LKLRQSKSEASGWMCCGTGFIGYTVFIFFLLSERTHGIHYSENLALFNQNILYFLAFLLVTLSIGKKRLFTDGHGNSPVWVDRYVAPFVFFLLGVIFPAMFFILIIK
jgi:hypothetical protein